MPVRVNDIHYRPSNCQGRTSYSDLDGGKTMTGAREAKSPDRTDQNSESLRILYLLNTSPLDDGGGGEERAREVAGRLAADDHAVTFLAGQTVPGLPTWAELRGCRVRHVTCIPDALFRFEMASFLLARYVFGVVHLPVLVWLLWREEFDVLVEGVTPYPTLAAPLAGLFDVPVVAEVHEVHGRDAYRTYDPVTATVLLSVQKALRWFEYAAYLVPSTHVAEQLAEYGVPDERLAVVPNGINAERYRVPVEQESGRLLTLGRLSKRKGHDFVLRAFVLIREMCREDPDLPDPTLTLLGKGPQRARLEALAADLGVETAVTFRGYVDEETKRRELNRASVFLFGSRKEGFGLAILEAMAAGCPVVARHCPVYEDFFTDGEHGRLVDGDDPETMARMAIAYLRDASERERVAASNRERAAEFDWDATAKLTEVVLTRIVDGDGLVITGNGLIPAGHLIPE